MALSEDLGVLVDQLRALSRTGSHEIVQEELEGIRAEDLAEGIVRLSTEEAVELLTLTDPDLAANVLVELPTDTARGIIQELPDDTIAYYLDVLPMDDALDLREELGDERFQALLHIIPDEDAAELRRLMSYPEDSVGQLMTERFFEVAPSTSMADLLEDIRRASDEKYETVNDVYVLSPDRHLLGVLSLRRAIRATPETTAQELMHAEVVTTQAHDPAEEAARTMARYGFYALPVLDPRGRMVGLFTGDDAQTVLREAETEDVLALGAVSGDAEAYMSLSVFKLYRRRIVWLLALFLAETLTGAVMRHYGGDGSIPAYMFFLPLIIGAGGNAGSQATTMITRSLAIGEIDSRDWLIIFRKEFITALLVGGSLGLIGILRAAAWGASPNLMISVGAALPTVVIWATAVGGLLPLAARRLRIDPAVMSAPFISTFVDATGLMIYFEIVKAAFGGKLPIG